MRKTTAQFLSGLALLILGVWLCVLNDARPVKAQLGMTGVGGGGFGGGGGSCSQATTLLAALDGSQNSAAVTAAICGMVTDGTIQKMDIFYQPGTGSAANALVNWANPGSFTQTKNGTCSYNSKNGFTGDGSTCNLNSNYSPATNGTHYTSTNVSIGACVLNTADHNDLMGTSISSAGIGLFGNSTTGVFYTLNDSNFNPANIGASYNGSLIASQSGGANTFYLNGASSATSSPGSTFSLTNPVVTFASSNNGTLQHFTADTINYMFVGGPLTSTDVTNIYNRMHAYLSTIGAASGC